MGSSRREERRKKAEAFLSFPSTSSSSKVHRPTDLGTQTRSLAAWQQLGSNAGRPMMREGRKERKVQRCAAPQRSSGLWGPRGGAADTGQVALSPSPTDSDTLSDSLYMASSYDSYHLLLLSSDGALLRFLNLRGGAPPPQQHRPLISFALLLPSIRLFSLLPPNLPYPTCTISTTNLRPPRASSDSTSNGPPSHRLVLALIRILNNKPNPTKTFDNV